MKVRTKIGVICLGSEIHVNGRLSTLMSSESSSSSASSVDISSGAMTYQNKMQKKQTEEKSRNLGSTWGHWSWWSNYVKIFLQRYHLTIRIGGQMN